MVQAGNNLKVILLGTGTSHGVPMIGCECEVCRSDDPKDKRTRTSLYVERGDVSVLVDTPPELRLQCIASGIRSVNGVLFTHAHADHVVGLDDLRRFNWLSGKAVPCYGTSETLGSLERMFSYAFKEMPDYPSSKPRLELCTIDGNPFEVDGFKIIPISLRHGCKMIVGYRFGDVAYCTDCNGIPDESFPLLQELDVLILDGLRETPHPTHFNLSQAVEMAGRIGARRTFFTHIAHELGHSRTNASLPDNMALAYDGQIVISETG